MFLKRTLLVAAAAVLPMLAACADQSPTAAPAPDLKQPTSVFDSRTGEPVAVNYPLNPTYADESGAAALFSTVPVECDPATQICACDPILDYGCEPCPRDNPDAWCYEPPCSPGLIQSVRTQRAGVDPNGGLEVNSLAGSSCNRMVVTGIGARITTDSYYTTLHVEYRQPNADGSLGGRVIYRTGSEPNHALEAWASVPDGYAIVGVGVGQSGSHDLRTLIVNYRRIELTASGVRMTGPIYTINAGVSPYGSIDAGYTTYSDTEVFSGAGFRSAVQQTKTLAAYLGQLP